MEDDLNLSDEERDVRYDDDDVDSDDSHEREYDDGNDGDNDNDSLDSSDGDNQEVERGTSSDSDAAAIKLELETLRRRFSGASRRINEEIQQRTALQNQWQAERAGLLEAIVRERIQDLPPAEQHQKLDEFRNALRQEYEQSHHEQEKAMMAEVARRAYIIDLSKRTGVPEAELENISDGETMEWFAARESQRKRKEQQTQKRTTRKKKGSDKFERTQHTSSPPKSPQTLDEGENEFLRLARSLR